jgi:hypothetical protein
MAMLPVFYVKVLERVTFLDWMPGLAMQSEVEENHESEWL